MWSCVKNIALKTHCFPHKNHCFPTCALFYPIVLKRKIITDCSYRFLIYMFWFWFYKCCNIVFCFCLPAFGLIMQAQNVYSSLFYAGHQYIYLLYYTPTTKYGGYTGFALSRRSVGPSVRPSPIRVRSITPLLMEGFPSNLNDTFTSTWVCA